MAVIYVLSLSADARENENIWKEVELNEEIPIFIRSPYPAAVTYLQKKKLSFTSFEKLFAEGTSFNAVKEQIVEQLTSAALEKGKVVYAVSGSTQFGEAAVATLLQENYELVFITSTAEEEQRKLLLPFFADNLLLVDILNAEKLPEVPGFPVLITGVVRGTAAQLYALLKGRYPQGHKLISISLDGVKKGFPLENLSAMEYDLVPYSLFLASPDQCTFDDLVRVMRRLRAPDGCPWDRQQDHRSLRTYVLEEAYEVVEAINKNDLLELQEELGDLLLQVVFHCQLATEAQNFGLAEVINGITAKLIRRHPHVFADQQVRNTDEVLKRWEELKRKEKFAQGRTTKISAEHSLPALMRALKVQRRASDLGFDWPGIEGSVAKLAEELAEFEDVYKNGDSVRIEEELGDLLFSIVNVARFLGIDPELSLIRAVDKFIRRFRYIENQVQREGGDFSHFTLAELDNWWNEAKNKGF
ncbi:MAG: nucleoside triphosphate pyrophosphohydrolase [Dethiobacteria bacterium]|jgi:tetrapyrrole methylase family protein/MazG family protein|nr:nucleoside triphosphate pyrophosphohydrolase [Bacillota bacterium]